MENLESEQPTEESCEKTAEAKAPIEESELSREQLEADMIKHRENLAKFHEDLKNIKT